MQNDQDNVTPPDSPRVDVLRVFRSDAACAYMDRFETGPNVAAEKKAKSDAAIAAIAELIEADREYDAAADAKFTSRGVSAALRRFDAARKRRAAALAKIAEGTK